MAPPGPVKIGHKKDGRRRRPHRCLVSRPPPYPAAGSASGIIGNFTNNFTKTFYVGQLKLFFPRKNYY